MSTPHPRPRPGRRTGRRLCPHPAPRQRRSPQALCVLFAPLLILGACAAGPTTPDHPAGASLGPGMRSFALVRDQASEKTAEHVRQPWAPAEFHPGLATRQPLLDPATADTRLGAAKRPDAATPPVPSRSFGAASGWLFFQLYQQSLSRVDGATCRFYPSCSGFGLQAVSDHGLTGVLMTFGRLQKNHQDDDRYPPHAEHPHRLADPLEGYVFFRGPLRLDAFSRLADPAFGWFMHVQAAEAAAPD